MGAYWTQQATYNDLEGCVCRWCDGWRGVRTLECVDDWSKIGGAHSWFKNSVRGGMVNNR